MNKKDIIKIVASSALQYTVGYAAGRTLKDCYDGYIYSQKAKDKELSAGSAACYLVSAVTLAYAMGKVGKKIHKAVCNAVDELLPDKVDETDEDPAAGNPFIANDCSGSMGHTI